MASLTWQRRLAAVGTGPSALVPTMKGWGGTGERGSLDLCTAECIWEKQHADVISPVKKSKIPIKPQRTFPQRIVGPGNPGLHQHSTSLSSTALLLHSAGLQSPCAGTELPLSVFCWGLPQHTHKGQS